MNRFIKVAVEPSDEFLLIDGIFSPELSLTVTIQNANTSVGSAVLKVEFDESVMRYAGVSLTVVRAGEGADVTGAALRDLKIGEALQVAALEHLWVSSKAAGISSPISRTLEGSKYVSARTVLEKFPPIEGRSSDNDAGKAAIAYRIAQLCGMPVLKTISKSLETSQSTAQRLVTRAKKLELING